MEREPSGGADGCFPAVAISRGGHPASRGGGSLRRRRRLRRIDERKRGQREAAGKKMSRSDGAARPSRPPGGAVLSGSITLAGTAVVRASPPQRWAESGGSGSSPPSWNQLSVSDLVGVLMEGPWGCCESLLVEVKFIFWASSYRHRGRDLGDGG